MSEFNLRNKKSITVAILSICFLSGFYFFNILQPKWKTVRIYKQALKDYEKQKKSGIKDPVFDPSKIAGLENITSWNDEEEVSEII